MSWSSTSSRWRDRRPILTKRWALVRDGHTHSHSHGVNEGEKPPANQAHTHSHGGHAHSHSHGEHSHSHGEHSHSHGDERRFVTGEKDVPFPGDDAASWPPRGTRLHTELVRAPYAFRRNPPLARGAGRGLCLFVDAFTAGVAGDMFVAAALDLGVPLDAVREQLAALSETPSPAGSPSPSQSPSFGGYAIDVVHDEKSCTTSMA